MIIIVLTAYPGLTFSRHIIQYSVIKYIILVLQKKHFYDACRNSLRHASRILLTLQSLDLSILQYDIGNAYD